MKRVYRGYELEVERGMCAGHRFLTWSIATASNSHVIDSGMGAPGVSKAAQMRVLKNRVDDEFFQRPIFRATGTDQRITPVDEIRFAEVRP